MNFFELILIGIGLAMDACAVAICKGLSMKKLEVKKSVTIGGYFGIFQGLMPLIGFVLGVSFQEIITKVDHWVAFILLSVIGINMFKESFAKESEEISEQINFKSMFPLALATSIDALAVGITFAFLKVNIIMASLVITITTFILSVLGTIIGHKFGQQFEAIAERTGGLILVLIGLKILLEHLNIF